jgi:hypothetical protein
VGGDPVNLVDKTGEIPTFTVDVIGQMPQLYSFTGIGGPTGLNAPSLMAPPVDEWGYTGGGGEGSGMNSNQEGQATPAGQRPPFSVTNFSREGPLQEKIAGVFRKIAQALEGNSDCAKWLRSEFVSGGELIDAITENNTFGHAEFHPFYESTSAVQGNRSIEGTPTGIPVDVSITINSQGAFFNRTAANGGAFSVGPRGYAGGSIQAQAQILIHEIAHTLGVAGFKSDFGNPAAVRENDASVDKHCGRLIRSLK